jgi:hypothetical protein
MSTKANPLQQLPWSVVLIACATLGLAPFAPPHVWEKLTMLFRGELKAPIDWFDLFFHGWTWVLLVLKLAFGRGPSGGSGS